MATWGATKAKAQFSGLLTAAETGPQLIRRRGQVFVVTTQEEIDRRVAEGRSGKRDKFISAWDALAPSFDECYDVEFSREQGKTREIDLG